MGSVTVINIVVFDNPCIFTTGFRFEVTFECTAPLSDGAWLPCRVLFGGLQASKPTVPC